MIKLNDSPNAYTDKAEGLAGATTKNHLFLGGIGNVKKIADPFIGGYSAFIFTYIPDRLKAILVDGGIKAPETFFTLMECTYKEFQGFNDIDLETAASTNGFVNNEHHYPSGSAGKNINEVTMKFQELIGNVYSNVFMMWTSAIRDPENGLSKFVHMRDYACEGIYINFSPAMGSNIAADRGASVNFAAYLTSMFPTRAPMAHFNYTTNDHSIAEVDVPFKCHALFNSYIVAAAREIAKSNIIYNRVMTPKQYIVDSYNLGTATADKAFKSVSATDVLIKLGLTPSLYTGQINATEEVSA